MPADHSPGLSYLSITEILSGYMKQPGAYTESCVIGGWLEGKSQTGYAGIPGKTHPEKFSTAFKGTEISPPPWCSAALVLMGNLP